jgi:hypothetical protein
VCTENHTNGLINQIRLLNQAAYATSTNSSTPPRLSSYDDRACVFTYLTAACRLSWIPSAAAVRAGDDFKQVAVRVFEVDTASAVVVIDLT